MQDARTIRKIVKVDDHTVLAFAGLTADARVLINKLRVEAQSYRLTMEDAPSVDYLARFLATTQQKYTQRGGVRPFGIATLLTGILPEEQPGNDDDATVTTPAAALSGRPYLYQTDPAGTHSRWKAQVIGGRNAKSLREFLEKNYQADMEEAATVKLAITALLEVVDSGAKTMEICVVRRGGISAMMEESEIETIVKEIEAEQEEKRTGGTSGGATAAATVTTE